MTGRGSCILCGAPACAEHHLTGARLDPKLLLPHCHDHHEVMHDDWNSAGVPAKTRNSNDQDQDQPPTVLHALHLRLTRLAMWLGRVTEADLFQPLSGQLAAALAGWASQLAACIAALDAHAPSWRSIPGVAPVSR